MLKVLCSFTFVWLSVASQALPIKNSPTLPNAFSQGFMMSDGSLGKVFYDYANRRQRLNHDHNTRSRLNQCYFWYNTTLPCVEYFTSTGEMWVDIPEEDFCCLESCADSCRENITFTPRPDFADSCTYEGVTQIEQFSCDTYSCPGTFRYFIEVATGIPVKFATADKKFVLLYNVSSYDIASQPASLFDLPQRCKRKNKCKMGHPIPP
jgi:hypothetical protein